MNKILVMSIAALLLTSVIVCAQDNGEKKIIEYLITSVEKLEGAKFIRNGSEFNGKEAAKHLRMKRDYAGVRIRTADDFIRLCASKSSVTGKPYTIRSADGKTMKSEDYFRMKLKEFNSAVK